jgi:CRISPR/Cas system CSM-associated protein Csm3 (group 7 of RAMP superfamily)
MANNQKSELIGKLILKATITNKSPLLIASGKNDVVDFEVIRDSSGKPYIPAAGFAGMLRSSFEELDLKPTLVNENLKYFWGSDDKNDESQSHIIIDDLKIIDDCRIVERDGVAINHQTNLGIDGNKFDYELIEPQAKFKLNAEITLRNGFNKDTILQFLCYIAQKGEKGEYQQGAFKSSGFGILEWQDVRIYSFDFSQDGSKWFEYLESQETKNLTEVYVDNKFIPLTCKLKDSLIIEGIFALKNSLIIRSDGDQTNADAKAPDKTHLKNSRGDALLTGKSIKGAIRHRAFKILNTIGNSKSDELVGNLFGYVNEITNSAKPSRVKSHETTIKGADAEQIQPRIKIDRYTNSTIEHALMQSQPVWHKNETFMLKFEIEDCKDFEAGLMLLVMKDLIKEDLPVGGEKAIGRGVLTGSKLTVKGKVSNTDVDIKFDNTGIIDNTKVSIVNNWVSELSKSITL